jgi:transcription factor MBP1
LTSSVGTWIPLSKGVLLAKKYGVYNDLRALFEYVPGQNSPPPAPKHQNNPSNRGQVKEPKAPRAPRQRKSKPTERAIQIRTDDSGAVSSQVSRHIQDDNYSNISDRLHDDDSHDEVETPGSVSLIEDDDYQLNQQAGSRKRKRETDPMETASMHVTRADITRADAEHQKYADELLDYFMLSQDRNAARGGLDFPAIPQGFNLNRTIDNENHTAISWACAMGDVAVVKEMLNHGADINIANLRGETPLVRAATFSNCFDRGVFDKMLNILQEQISIRDIHGASVFHHVAHTAHIKTSDRIQRAKHYLERLLLRVKDIMSTADMHRLLNLPDYNGDTAFHIAARYSRRLTKLFQAAGAASDIPNENGETVDQQLRQFVRNHDGDTRLLQSSSPVGPHSYRSHGGEHNILTNGLSRNNYQFESTKALATSFHELANDHLNALLKEREEELQEKDALHSDLDRAYQQKTNELHHWRQKRNELMLLDSEDMSSIAEQYPQVVYNAEGLEEQKQHRLLHSSVQKEEEKYHLAKTNGIIKESTAVENHIANLYQLREFQTERTPLVKDVVQAQAVESMGVPGEIYKKILTGLLPIQKGELLEVIDDIVQDLEMNNGEHALVEAV